MTQATFEPEVFKIPMPMDFEDEDFAGVMERADAVCAAAESIVEKLDVVGKDLPTPTPVDEARARSAFHNPTDKSIGQIKTTSAGMKLAALIREYDVPVIHSAQQIRTVVTNKLLDNLNAPKPSDQLRAAELLGKIADVNLFAERTTVTIEHKTDDELRALLKEKFGKLKSLAAHKTIDITNATDVTAIDVTPQKEVAG